MHALILDDGMFSREAITRPENMRKLDGLDLTLDFVKDTNGGRFATPAEFVGRLERVGPEGWIAVDQEVREKLPRADILIVHTSGVTAEMMDLSPNLSLIYCLRSGAEGINREAAAARGIPVCNAPSRLAEPVADLTVALMLAECRGLARCELQRTGGAWRPDDIRDASNAALCNLTVGLVGYGGIARKVAARLVLGFGARVMASDPYADAAMMREDGVEPVDLDTLLAQADIVALMARLTDETRGMFSHAQFAKMKPTAIFINTARGGLVDEPALVKALQERTIRSAGLDVFATEPLPQDSPLLALDNVTLTPHMAGVTTDIVPNTLSIMAQEMARFLHGEALQYKVN